MGRLPSTSGTMRQEELARVLDPLEPTLAHAEDPHLLGRAEAVLAGAQDAEGLAAVALERQHHVDQMLEHARPRDRALLRHVAHEHERRANALGRGRQQRRRLAHLRHRAGRRLDALGVQRLDRVDEHDRRPALAPRLGQRLDPRLRQHQQRVGKAGQAIGAQPQLLPALLTRHV
jgi:hypothetical protein